MRKRNQQQPVCNSAEHTVAHGAQCRTPVHFTLFALYKGNENGGKHGHNCGGEHGVACRRGLFKGCQLEHGRTENQIPPATLQHNAAPAIPTAPAVPEAPVASAAFCANCGNQLTSGARFCSRCGTPVSVPDKKLCPNCQTEARESDIFCTACGTRLK